MALNARGWVAGYAAFFVFVSGINVTFFLAGVRLPLWTMIPIYGAGTFILCIFLFFVPDRKNVQRESVMHKDLNRPT